MIVPILLTAGIVGGLLYLSPLLALRNQGPGSGPNTRPPPPTPPPPPPPSPRPFAGLPYGTVVQLYPEKNVFGPRVRGVPGDVVKIVGETNPGTVWSSYLAIDNARCFLPDNLCPKRTLLETDIETRIS